MGKTREDTPRKRWQQALSGMSLAAAMMLGSAVVVPHPAWAYWRVTASRTTYHAPVHHQTYHAPVQHQTYHAAPARTTSRSSGGFWSHLVKTISTAVHHVTQAVTKTVQHVSQSVSAWYQKGVQRANQSVTTAFGANGQKNAVDAHTGRILTTTRQSHNTYHPKAVAPRWNVTSQLAPKTPSGWYSLVGGNKNTDPFGILTPITGSTQKTSTNHRTSTTKGTAVVKPYQPPSSQKPKPKPQPKPVIPRGVVPVVNKVTQTSQGGQSSGGTNGTGQKHATQQTNTGTTASNTGNTQNNTPSPSSGTSTGGSQPVNQRPSGNTGGQSVVIVNASPAGPSALTPEPATLPDYLVNNTVLPAAEQKTQTVQNTANNAACVTPETKTVMVPHTESVDVPVQQAYTYAITVDVPVTTTHWEWVSYTATTEVAQRTWVSTNHWQSYWYWTPQKGWQESGWWVTGGYWSVEMVPETYTAWHWVPVTTTSEIPETRWVTGTRTVMQAETQTVMVPETQTVYVACQTA